MVTPFVSMNPKGLQMPLYNWWHYSYRRRYFFNFPTHETDLRRRYKPELSCSKYWGRLPFEYDLDILGKPFSENIIDECYTNWENHAISGGHKGQNGDNSGCVGEGNGDKNINGLYGDGDSIGWTKWQGKYK